MCDWLPAIVGTLLAALAALLLAVVGWWLNRVRRRRAVARVLFFEVKFLRIDWLSSLANGVVPTWVPSYPAAWRALADVGADLFPDALLRRLTEAAITVDRLRTGYVLTDEGVADLRAIAARSERDLAAYFGEPFDAATEGWLATHEAQFGDKP